MSPWMDLNDSDAHEHQPSLHDVVLLKLIWPYVKPQWPYLLASLLLLPLASLAQIAQPVLLKQAVDGPMTHHQWVLLGWMSLGFAGLLGLQFALKYTHMMFAQYTGQRVIYALRCALYNHLQGLDQSFYAKQPIGKLVSRLSSDVENINEMFASGAVSILSDVVSIIGIIITMIVLSPNLSTAVLFMVPVVIAVMEFFRRRSRLIYNELRVQAAQINVQLQESFSGMDVIQLLNRQPINTRVFGELSLANTRTSLRSILYDSSFTASVDWLSYITLTLVIGVFAWFTTCPEVSTGCLHVNGLTLGLLVAYLQYIQMLFEPIEDLSDKFTIVQSGLASIEKLSELLLETPNITSPNNPVPLTGKKGRIVFHDVSFRYPNSHKDALSHINLTIEPGQRIALVGPSGAGKSTLIKLFNRTLDPSSGKIILDDTPLNEFSLSDLRHHVGIIPQEDFMFSRTLKENITLNYPSDNDSDDAIMALLTQLGADSIVKQLPKGIHTVMSERGRTLSSGERQLLMFARALWHNPCVFILDEATSSVDPKTESLIQKAIQTLFEGRTAIIVAHRLSTIQEVDTILVVEDGVITEQGSPKELLAQNGRYAELYRYFFQSE